jgi:hypothetical protein
MRDGMPEVQLKLPILGNEEVGHRRHDRAQLLEVQVVEEPDNGGKKLMAGKK